MTLFPRTCRILVAASVLAVAAVPGPARLRAQSPARPSPPAPPAHPLDPLSADEIEAATRLLRREQKLPEHVRFPLVVLHEPPKKQVLGWKPGRQLAREAFVVVFDRPANRTAEAVVDLTAGAVRSYKTREGVQPHVLGEEYREAPKVILADSRVREAFGRRGVTDLDQVKVDLWAPGPLDLPDQPRGARLARATCYVRGGAANSYSRPVEGLTVVVNLNTMKVVRVVDTGSAPVPAAAPDITGRATEAGPRPRPLRQVMPRGPSVTVRGHEVRWLNWRFRLAGHQREGLVLHQVGFADGGRVRPVLYRASLSEILVPYGDPDQHWVWRNAFDEGEYTLGAMMNTLVAGQDVPEYAVLRDCVFPDEQGHPWVRAGGIALYERDAGLLWKHTEEVPGGFKVTRRPARELVVTFYATLGNYDYGFNWIFTEDGQLRAEVELTGMLLAKAVGADVCPRCQELKQAGPGEAVVPRGADRPGTLVARNVVATNHQHFFNFRLDLDVDGPANSVLEMNTVAAAAPADFPGPGSNAFVLEETILKSEADARRTVNAASHRRWKVYNPNVTNALGHSPGYVLVPGANGAPYLTADTTTRRRADFISTHLGVTRYKAGELYAAGDYPNQSRGGDGLPHYLADNEGLVNADVVLWYTLGETHVARPEEWPVMPTARAGFRLVPSGFFERNPTVK